MKTAIMLLIISTAISAEWRSWNFISAPDWNTNSQSGCYHLDTQFTDVGGHIVNGAYRVIVKTGDSTWSGNSFLNWNFTLGNDYRYSLSFDFYVQTLSLYSQLFIGFTDSTHNVPINNSSARGMGLSIGRNYDGSIVGFTGQSEYFSHVDTLNRPSLLTAGRTYRCQFEYNHNYWQMTVLRLPDNQSIYSSNAYFDLSEPFTHLTIGNKGYSSAYGNGVAVERILIDTLMVSRDTIQSGSTTQERSKIHSKNITSVKATPNPLRSYTTLQIEVPSGITARHKLMVYSPSGACVMDLSSELHKRTGSVQTSIYINVNHLPAGVYLAQLFDGSKNKTTALSVIR